MKSDLRGTGLVLAVSLLVVLGGCGGGSGNTPPASTAAASNPVTTAPTWLPADNPLNEFTNYTFTTTATDPDIGVGIASYIWNFGDGSAPVTTTKPTVSYSYSTAASFSLQVAAVTTAGVTGAAVAETVNVIAATSPITVTATAPAAASTVQVGVGSTTGVQVVFKITVADSGSGTIAPAGITLTTNDTNSPAPTVGTPVSQGSGVWTIPVTFQAAAAAGTRTFIPAVVVVDSNGASSLPTVFPALTVTSLVLAAATTPTITITTPTAANTAAYTSVPQNLVFTLTDLDGYPLTYSVDWGDGSQVVTGSATNNTAAGVSIPLTHAYPDTYTGKATVTVTATDGTIPAAPLTLTYTLAFNAYPTAVITSPQASGIIPPAVAALNLPATAPAVVVVPNNGKVTFLGTATLPGYELSANTGTLTYSWSFPGGSPSSATSAPNVPVLVTYPTNTNSTTVNTYTASFTVTDDLHRVSSADPTMVSPPATAAAATAFQQSYQRTIVVDGADTQSFTMSFLYRQRSGSSAADTYSPASTTGHGFNSVVTIYQDGISNTFNVSNGNTATTVIPVRSDVPFWLNIPVIAGDVTDPYSYMVSIPNLPGLDPDLQACGTGLPRTLLASEGTAFAFTNATAPWDPQLQITTGSGFGAEGGSTVQRALQGGCDLNNDGCAATGTYETQYRWLDRLAIPLANPALNGLAVNTAWNQANNNIGGFSGIYGYQGTPEWFVLEKSPAVQDWNEAATTPAVSGFYSATAPTTMGFVTNDSFNQLHTTSVHFTVTGLEVYRAPASNIDNYNFAQMIGAGGTFNYMYDHEIAGGESAGGINPTPMGLTQFVFLSGLVNNAPASPLSGGISLVSVPYNNNDINRIPNNPTTYQPFAYLGNFGYAEYLWTSVWARPLVLNRTNLSYFDAHFNGSQSGGEQGATFFPYNSPYTSPQYQTISAFTSATALNEECGNATHTVPLPEFYFSNPSQAWPSATNVEPDGSSYDLTVANGGTFDASSPVTEPGHTGTNHGVGRFFWTAYTPKYNSLTGSIISRTWLADGTSSPAGQIPTSFATATSADASTAWGLLPPQDVTVDKRTRVNGIAQTGTLGGYRVIWYNPTQNTLSSGSKVVSPDFWAIQIAPEANSAASGQVFLLSANYPRTGQSITAPIVTDAQAFLPSGAATYQAPVNGGTGDLDGPGYCWFDVPPELQPATGVPVQITVFALKSILKNNPVPSARVINRSEWIEAVKTVTANVSAQAGPFDVSFAHKIPFNYPWDIVVVNSAVTPVSGN